MEPSHQNQPQMSKAGVREMGARIRCIDVPVSLSRPEWTHLPAAWEAFRSLSVSQGQWLLQMGMGMIPTDRREEVKQGKGGFYDTGDSVVGPAYRHRTEPAGPCPPSVQAH